MIYNVKQLKELFNCGEQSVYDAIHTGELVAFKVGVAFCVSQQALDNFIRNKEESAMQRVQAERSKDICQSVSKRMVSGISTSSRQLENALDRLLAPGTNSKHKSSMTN